MAFLRWIIALPIIVGAVLFALAHPEPVSLTLNPLKAPVELPLYAVSFFFLGVGFLIGALMAWIGMAHIRHERRQQRKTIRQLEKDINEANEKWMDALAKTGPAAKEDYEHD
jgi:uncharacterized integral membrane protein